MFINFFDCTTPVCSYVLVRQSRTDPYKRLGLFWRGEPLATATTDIFLLISAAMRPWAKSKGYVMAVVSKAVADEAAMLAERFKDS